MVDLTSDWRLLEFSGNNAAMNMAIDEAILTTCSKKQSPNTIRLYRWNPSAVSVGFFQSVEAEVNLDACKAEGVDVVRRLTGGGAVFHDSLGEVTYSLIAGEDEPFIPKDIIRSYEVICGGIINGLQSLGLNASFHAVNDIIIGGKKISGNAQTRRLGIVLQHGTILVDADLEKMFNLLRVSDKKIRDKMIVSAQQRVTTLKRELSKKPSLEDVAESLERGFEKALNLRFTKGSLTKEEMTLAEDLSKEKYSNPEWIFRR